MSDQTESAERRLRPPGSRLILVSPVSGAPPEPPLDEPSFAGRSNSQMAGDVVARLWGASWIPVMILLTTCIAVLLAWCLREPEPKKAPPREIRSVQSPKVGSVPIRVIPGGERFRS